MQEKGEKKKESKFEETPVADFFMGIFLIVLSLIVMYAAWSWPLLGPFAASAALSPLLITGSLLIMAIFLLVNAIRMQGHRNLVARLKQSWAGEDTQPTIMTLALVLIYMIVLLNILSFEIATLIYIAVSLYIFWQRKAWLVLVIAGTAVAFYTVVFQYFFKILLPGSSF
jgi:hypothetical protein